MAFFQDSRVILLLGVFLIAPAVIDSQPTALGWDDAHYFHRMVCVTRAFNAFDLSGLNECLHLAVKAPLIGWMGLPWGHVVTTPKGLGLASVSLVFFTLFAFGGLANLLLRRGVPQLVLLLACASVGVNQLAARVAGAFLGDTLSAVLISLILLLPLLELDGESSLPRPWVRGLVWGSLMAVAVMAKTSAGFFAITMVPLLIFLRVRRFGWNDAFRATLAMLLAASPIIFYHLFYWDEVIGHVLLSTVGPIAKYTSYNLDAAEYLTKLLEISGIISLLLVLPIVSFISWHWSRSRWIMVWPLLVLLSYLAIIALSENHDMRYGLPVVIGLPFLLAGFTAQIKLKHFPPGSIPLLISACLALSIPMVVRPDLRFVQEAQTALSVLPTDHPLKVLLASDDSVINIETLRLAQQLDFPRFKNLLIDTVVYDEALGHSTEEILTRLSEADVVILLRSVPVREAPDWTNQVAKEVRKNLVYSRLTLSQYFEVYLLSH
ncbi:conserved membrane hypothetical protein [Gammaproteobacteria bacterium]